MQIGDWALFSVMPYAFARISAVLATRVEDYYRKSGELGSGNTNNFISQSWWQPRPLADPYSIVCGG